MSLDVDYDDGLYAVYDRGQSLPPPTENLLLDAFTRLAPAGRPLTVCDLGSGTGRLSPGLASRFGGPVVGVEPSGRMRSLACARRPHPGVGYVGGTAERLPLRSGSCDLVVLFLVFHHVIDKPLALQEIARVLRPGGRVLICGNFAGRPSPRAWAAYFPRAHDLEERALPSLEDTEKAAVRAGLPVSALESLELTIAPSLAAYHDRLRYLAVSAFRQLTGPELAAGLGLLAVAAEAERTPAPVVSSVDVLALTRT
ncbi:class I SAM-dependent methyltransferase [Longispora albida]|uniref:class I SAM-dependent methyltransferase n=1 Tax=Longispora albida TaxID=203523 RepID=UPI00039D1D35|nr:class I SAM-dependent methyltransferase [Longispora albida]